MGTLIHLPSRTVDLGQVLEIRDDRDNELTLLIGSYDAVELLVLRDADAVVMRDWLAKDYQHYLERRLAKGQPIFDSSHTLPPPVEEPPF